MLVEFIVIVVLMTPIIALIVYLVKSGEEECVEGLDECLQEWESVKEGWAEI